MTSTERREKEKMVTKKQSIGNTQTHTHVWRELKC